MEMMLAWSKSFTFRNGEGLVPEIELGFQETLLTTVHHLGDFRHWTCSLNISYNQPDPLLILLLCLKIQWAFWLAGGDFISSRSDVNRQVTGAVPCTRLVCSEQRTEEEPWEVRGSLALWRTGWKVSVGASLQKCQPQPGVG